MPERVATPSACDANTTPLGSVPLSLTVAAGAPTVVTSNMSGAPTVAVVLAVEVNPGIWSTVSANVCDAGTPTPLVAVTLTS